MNWKEHSTLIGSTKAYSEGSVEAIIEKLIEDIPDGEGLLRDIKEELKAKWLGETK